MIGNIGYYVMEEIPWHRLSTAYSTAEEVPQWMKGLQSADVIIADDSLQQLQQHLEHQGTLWQVTPIALYFISEMFRLAVENKNVLLVYRILALYHSVFVTAQQWAGEKFSPKSHFSEMLLEENLLPTDVEELENFYADLPEDLFASYFIYSWVVFWNSYTAQESTIASWRIPEIDSILLLFSEPNTRDTLTSMLKEI